MKAVFVDPSGRRRRLARRAGVCVAVPAIGYAALLVSTVLGGPTLHTPWVPVPDGVRQVTEPRPTVPVTTPGNGATPTTPTRVPTDGPTEQVVDRTTPVPSTPPSSTPPTPVPSVSPVPPVPPSSTQPSTPGQTRRPTAPPGRSSHSPTAHPTPGPKKTP